MKRLALILALVFVVAVALPALAGKNNKGNSAPSGSHYNLNILGKTTCPGDELIDSNRHTIMVLLNFDDGDNTGATQASLDRRNKIFLQEGDFKVIDGNACDGDGATFQLPANPYTGDVDDPTFQEYEVYIRALGTPGGSATITTCAFDPALDPDAVVCSSESVTVTRNKGKSGFSRVTKELTTMCLATNGNGKCTDRVGIFDPEFYDYFWDYDNNGLRLAQLRFYPVGE